MAAPTATVHEHWSGRLVFLMASVGFAVGLGNIWRFPYLTGENGGGAFVVIYLACAFGIGVPLLMAELMIGRRGGLSPIGSMRAVAAETGASKSWSGVGLMALAAVFLILTYYAVIAGWTMDYFVRALSDDFRGITANGSQNMFEGLKSSPLRLVFWQTVVIAVMVLVICRGVKAGIEKAVNILMPALFVCLITMVIYAAIAGDFAAGFKFLLKPDFSKVTAGTFLVAIGQAFFSIGIAMATMMTYGAYLDKKVSIRNSAVIVVSADTFVALLAGFAIFPLVFANGLEPGSGPGLIFETLPVAFGQMFGGRAFGAVFFLLLIAAAMTSCIGCMEPLISWAEEHRGIKRLKAALIGGAIVWAVGLGTVASFGGWSDVFPLAFIPVFEQATVYGIVDYVSANLLLPVGGLLMALFAGWAISRDVALAELGLHRDSLSFKVWRLVIRYLAPAAILAMLIAGVSE